MATVRSKRFLQKERYFTQNPGETDAEFNARIDETYRKEARQRDKKRAFWWLISLVIGGICCIILF